MQTLSLSDNEIEKMREFYLDELQKTLHRLDHLKTVLKELGEVGVATEIATGQKHETVAPGNTTATEKKATRKKRSRKPGRKSVWEPLIIKRLRQLDKPVTYEDLTDEVMNLAKIPSEKRKSTKQSIVSVAFRLRSRDNKIDTYSAGTKEKYVGLKQWFDEPGKLSKEYARRIKK